ncbi:MAG: hypothetical protein SGARI_004218 [Bacillariaceae sp.]
MSDSSSLFHLKSRMNRLTCTATLLAVVAVNVPDGVHGFSTTLSTARKVWNIKANAPQKFALFGILDEFMEAEDNSQAGGDASSDVTTEDPQSMELYHSLIFASDLEHEISNRLDDCTDPSFLEYLTASANTAQDKDEQQGLLDLINNIEQVKTTLETKAIAEQQAAAEAIKAKKEAEDEMATNTSTTSAKSNKMMSNADIIRKANEIDAAIALSDEEKPSDFISDCREVVNLSSGFNDSGQMKVGGR